MGQFLWRKNTHCAVFAVVSAFAVDMPAPHAGHGLAQWFPVGANVGLWQTAKNIQLWPKLTQQAAVSLLHTARCGAHLQNFTHHLGQRNQGAHFGLARQLRCGIAVGQFQYPVQHAYGQRLAAHRADIAKGQRILGLKHHVAGAVAVEVVLALIGVEFHGTDKAAVQRALILSFGRGAQGRKHACIAGAARKKIGLAAQVGPGMRVRIGHKGVAIKPADKAVHGRVGRKTGFKGKDVLRKITVAVL